MNRCRLDAEQVRDALLLASGQLDLAMGGPSVRQFVLSPGIHVTPKVDYDAFDVDSADSRRRAIYRFVFRTLPDPMMDTLDCADASQLTPARNQSITALQALTMLNHALMVKQCAHVAERAARAGPRVEDEVQCAGRLVLGRELSASELAELVPFVRRHGLANLCRVM